MALKETRPLLQVREEEGEVADGVLWTFGCHFYREEGQEKWRTGAWTAGRLWQA